MVTDGLKERMNQAAVGIPFDEAVAHWRERAESAPTPELRALFNNFITTLNHMQITGVALCPCCLKPIGQLNGVTTVAAPTAGVCRACGCTNNDCRQCVAKTGWPCHWVEPDLCSACVTTAITSDYDAICQPDRREQCQQ
jgi:hypothetical protein